MKKGTRGARVLETMVNNIISRWIKTCVTWPGAYDKDGYGRIVFVKNGKRTRVRVHRLAWEMAMTQKIPSGMLCCHICDNPSCINPFHLFVGTTQDNTADMVMKGRQAKGNSHAWSLHPDKAPRGEENGNSSLTGAEVLAIRSEYGKEVRSQRKLAKKYKVTKRCIQQIVRKETWRHI